MEPSLLLRIVHTHTGATIAETDQVAAFSYDYEMSKPGTFSFTVLPNNPVADALADATGGESTLGTVLPYKIGLSLDGGANFDVWKAIQNVTREVYTSDQGDTLFHSYTTIGEDRVTFHGIAFSQILDGDPGTIPIDGINTSLLAGSSHWSWMKGLFQTGPPGIKYAVVVDPTLQDVKLDADIYADYLIDALNALISQVGGLYISGDLAPYGTRGVWVEDSSDAALNLSAVDRSLTVGHIGTAPAAAFSSDADLTDMNQVQILEESGPFQPNIQLDRMRTQCAFEGGTTNHGIPDGASVFCPFVINTTHDSASLNWNDSLCVFAAVDSSGSGGVYYWPHDGIGYRIGQSLSVRDLQYIPEMNLFVVATDTGVYTHSSDVTDTSAWQRLGFILSPCKKLVAQALGLSGTTVSQVIVQVSTTGSGDGLYVYPAISGDDTGYDYGYGGWSNLVQGQVDVWSYSVTGDELVMVDPNDRQRVLIIYYVTDPAISTTTRMYLPNYETPTGITTLDNGYAITSDLGAFGVYFMDPSGSMTDMNPDATLVDLAGIPVMVNSLYHYNGPLVLGENTYTVKYFALTDAGVFFTQNATGGSWQPPDSASGINNENITGLAVGRPQTLITRVVNRLYATTNNSFWVSNTSGALWRDELKLPVSLGAYFTAIGKLLGETPFLHNDVTSIGTLASGGTSGTSGRNLPGPIPSPYGLGGDLVWVRPLNQRCEWTYRLVHSLPTTPDNPMEFGEVQEIGTDADIGAATASGMLAQLHVRYLSTRSQTQVLASIDSIIDDTGRANRKLRPTHQVTVTYDTTPIYSLQLSNTVMWVIKQHVEKTDSDTRVRSVTSLGALPIAQERTLAEFAEAVQYTQSKGARYGRRR